MSTARTNQIHQDVQAQIDGAETPEHAWHAFEVASAMEEVVRHTHELDGETYEPHRYRPPHFLKPIVTTFVTEPTVVKMQALLDGDDPLICDRLLPKGIGQ